KETDRRRKSLQRLENAEEVITLIRQQFCQRGFAGFKIVREDHLAHRVNAVALEEHMFRAREADAYGAERDGVRGLLRRVRVGADLQARGFGAPFHQLREALEFLSSLRRLVAADETGDDL